MRLTIRILVSNSGSTSLEVNEQGYRVSTQVGAPMSSHDWSHQTEGPKWKVVSTDRNGWLRVTAYTADARE